MKVTEEMVEAAARKLPVTLKWQNLETLTWADRIDLARYALEAAAAVAEREAAE